MADQNAAGRNSILSALGVPEAVVLVRAEPAERLRGRVAAVRVPAGLAELAAHKADMPVAPADDGLAVETEMHGRRGPIARRTVAEIPERRLRERVLLKAPGARIGGSRKHHG